MMHGTQSEDGRDRNAPLLLALVALLILGACGDGATEPEPEPTPSPPSVASVEVASPIDTLLAVGWGAQFVATARNAQGGSMTADFTWSSSAPDVAAVDGNGQVSPAAPGVAVISATADGVSGSLGIEVVAADVGAAAGVMEDPLLGHLAGGLGAAGVATQAALTACGDALTAGNLVAADGCLETLRATAAAATEADDRVLLAVLLLMSEHAAGLLEL